MDQPGKDQWDVRSCLPGYPSGGITLHQFQHLADGHLVEITGYGMLQAGSCYGKIQGPIVLVRPGKQTIDQAPHKRITPSYPVYYMCDLVGGCFI